MSRFLNMLAVGTLCLSFGVAPLSTVFAEEGGKPKKEHAGAMVAGEITKVDAAAKSVTVKAKDAEKTFTVDDKTVITIEGVAGTIEGLKEGQKVKVTANDAGLASKILVGAAAPHKKDK